jgi:transposase
MALNLATSQHELIRDMIVSKSLKNSQMAEVAGCSPRSIKSIRSNPRCFGTTKAPSNGGGRPRSITSPMLETLGQHLLEKLFQYLDEIVVFLWDEFEALVIISSISRALASIDWSNNAARRVPKERNPDLRDFYLYNLSSFSSYNLVYVDESSYDKRIGFRRAGWSPLGVTPVKIAWFQREYWYQTLPAYSQEGIVLARVFQGTTDSAVFEDFIEQLLTRCGRWPESNSVLVIDNASFHHTERIEQMCADAS